MIDFTPLTDVVGDAGAAAVIGALLGLGFGVLAQRSQFCVRSAVLEANTGAPGKALSVWFAALGSAIAAVTFLVLWDGIAVEAVKLRTDPVGLSGAAIGGLLFGAGMILARGCASRHLVLAATGNLRSWVTFGVFALTVAATIWGPLSPFQSAISGLWVLSPNYSDGLAALGLGGEVAIAAGIAIVLAAIVLAVRQRHVLAAAGGIGIGLLVAAGWALTTGLAGHTFEPTQIESLAFTAPAGNVIMALRAPFEAIAMFDTGFIPGVFAGAVVAAILFRAIKLQWFASVGDAVRYAVGAVLMGFGGVMALGCSVGSMSNAALMVTSSWVALVMIWVGASLAYQLIDAPATTSGQLPVASDVAPAR